MSEVDPDPDLPDEGYGRAELGGRVAPDSGDPTGGGTRGQVGEVPSVAADEPSDGTRYPVGGGHVGEEPDASPGGGREGGA